MKSKFAQKLVNISGEQPPTCEDSKDNNSELFKLPKLPIYLGLFIESDSIDFVKDYVLMGLQKLTEVYKDDQEIKATFQTISDRTSEKLKFVKDMHITSLFVGGNKKKAESEYFTTFKPNYEFSIDIVGFLVVPGKIMVGICYPDQSVIKIENDFPHMTLMTGEWAAKFSNDSMRELFGEGKPLHKEYLDKNDNFTYKGEIQTKDKGMAYVVTNLPHLRLRVKAKAVV
jgi:hypothetical protein